MPTASSLPDQLKDWMLHRSHEWWLVSSVLSASVGLICFAVSFFNHHLKEWNLLLKFSIISVACIALICIAVLIAKKMLEGSNPWVKAHLVFFAIIVTYILTFFLDKEKEEEPDVYGLVSYAAFAVLFLSLAIQTRLGFLGEIVYFFLGVLLIRLMEIKWWLVFPGACFSYPLIILSSFLDELSGERGRLPIRTPLPASPDAETSHVDDTGALMSPQQSNNTDTDTVPLLAPQPPVRRDDLLDVFRHALRPLNGMDREVARELQRPLKDYITDRSEEVPEVLVNDPNFLVDRISPQVLDELNRLMKNSPQFEEHIKNLVVDEYSRSRKRFLEICQVELQLNVSERHRIQRWIKLSTIALRMLFPYERRLCQRIFGSHSEISDKCFMQVCSELAQDLLNFTDHIANRRNFEQMSYSHSIFQVFRTLNLSIPAFESLFSNSHFGSSLWIEAARVKERLCRVIKDYFFTELEELAHADGSGYYIRDKIHSTTIRVMFRLSDAFRERDTLELILHDYPMVDVMEGVSSLSTHIAWMIELLETNLEAFTKKFKNASVGSIYLIDNVNYIVKKVCGTQLNTILGGTWLEEQSAKIDQYIKDYQRISWDNVLGFLKLDSDNVTAESMKEKLRSFNEQFPKTLVEQRHSSLDDQKLREDIIESVRLVLVPAYGNFINKFRDILLDHADEYIEYSTSEVESRLRGTLDGSFFAFF
ncbi:hypothetical protein Ahy_B07g087149 isoform B [Arachis hypogaea]|uniref:Exocyst subunit Exo70 family protein n=1 Tax=Arachis hypogaea TaxID=3818 RepID=A0A444YBH4_ARAHY|nr:hypothetical protein Ahy_B07g087149 isoform B [Arachis hypogaea]